MFKARFAGWAKIACSDLTQWQSCSFAVDGCALTPIRSDSKAVIENPSWQVEELGIAFCFASTSSVAAEF
jgi:hypothetical protein